MKSKTWLITGISNGLGKALAETVIQKGDYVIGTFRKEGQVAAFNQRKLAKLL
jgi:NAD(P)-dependent dehydrogenase (short-subunit alcohol dehydrogenase family)